MSMKTFFAWASTINERVDDSYESRYGVLPIGDSSGQILVGYTKDGKPMYQSTKRPDGSPVVPPPADADTTPPSADAGTTPSPSADGPAVPVDPPQTIGDRIRTRTGDPGGQNTGFDFNPVTGTAPGRGGARTAGQISPNASVAEIEWQKRLMTDKMSSYTDRSDQMTTARGKAAATSNYKRRERNIQREKDRFDMLKPVYAANRTRALADADAKAAAAAAAASSGNGSGSGQRVGNTRRSGY